MTDPMAATPGWVDGSLDRIFADLPPQTKAAQDAFAQCLARGKNPAEPSDLLGTEFAGCHAALKHALEEAGLEDQLIARTMGAVEALEAEIGIDS